MPPIKTYSDTFPPEFFESISDNNLNVKDSFVTNPKITRRSVIEEKAAVHKERMSLYDGMELNKSRSKILLDKLDNVGVTVLPNSSEDAYLKSLQSTMVSFDKKLLEFESNKLGRINSKAHQLNIFQTLPTVAGHYSTDAIVVPSQMSDSSSTSSRHRRANLVPVKIDHISPPNSSQSSRMGSENNSVGSKKYLSKWELKVKYLETVSNRVRATSDDSLSVDTDAWLPQVDSVGEFSKLKNNVLISKSNRNAKRDRNGAALSDSKQSRSTTATLKHNMDDAAPNESL